MQTSAKAAAIAKELIAKEQSKTYTRGGYVTTADWARLMRALLAANFPGTKFYVRTDNFSMGSSIDVYFDGVETGPDGYPKREECWEHGDGHNYGRTHSVPKEGAPKLHEVKKLVDSFGGKSFDGMIDMEYYYDSYLMPDGRVIFGGTTGTAGSRGTVDKVEVEKPAGSMKMGTHAWLRVEDHLPYDVRAKAKPAA